MSAGKPMFVHASRVVSLELSARPVIMELDKMGLSLARAFEPGLFSSKQLRIDVGSLLLLRASDGWCWALIRKLDANGCLVLEREAPSNSRLVAPPAAEEPPVNRSRRAAA